MQQTSSERDRFSGVIDRADTFYERREIYLFVNSVQYAIVNNNKAVN